MRMVLRLLPLLCFGLLLGQCKSTRYTTDNLPEKQLLFGSGGGFAGAYTTYILLENGQCFRLRQPGDQMEALPNLGRSATKKLWAEADALAMKDYAYNNPGNMSYYLEIKQDSTRNRLTWSDMAPVERQDILDFYQKLMNSIK